MNKDAPTLRPALGLVAIAVALGACGGTGPSMAAPSAGGAAVATITPRASAAATMPLQPGFAMYKGNPQRTGELLGPGPSGSVTTLWTVATDGPIKSSPAVIGTAMFIVAGDGHVLSLDAATGANRWTSADGGYIGTPTAAEDRIFTVGEDGGLSALNAADGTFVWHVAASILPNHNPLAFADLVIAGGADHGLTAYDAATGAVRWSVATGGNLARGASTDGSSVYIGSDDGMLHAISIANGTPVWTHQTSSGEFTTSAVRDGTLYAAAHNESGGDTLYAVDAATGSERWTFIPPGGERLRSPSVDAEALYDGAVGGPVYSLSLADGSIRWTYEATSQSEAPISIVGDTLYLFGDDRNAIALDRTTGAERWRVGLGASDAVEAGTSVADGRVLAGTAAGKIVALGSTALVVASTAPVAPSASPAASSDAGPLQPVGELTAPGGLSVPSDVAIDPIGRIWVTEGGANRFAIFAPDGKFIERWGGPGSANGEFAMTPNCCEGSPAANIVFENDGGFYVNDPGNDRVQHFDKSRAWTVNIGRFGDLDGQLIDPQGVALGADGNIYVPDSTRGDVQVFDAQGHFVRKLEGSATGAPTLADGGPGAAVVADEVYVVDRGGVNVMKVDGSGLRRISDPAFGNVVDPNLAPDGRLWLADWDAKFHALDPATGEVVGTWKVGPGWPESDVQGIGVAEDGTVYVAEWEFGKVEIFKPTLP